MIKVKIYNATADIEKAVLLEITVLISKLKLKGYIETTKEGKVYVGD